MMVDNDYYRRYAEKLSKKLLRQRRTKMIFKRSCEDEKTLYVCLFGRRFVFREGKYVGWYKP